jgi:hypothetical protein
MANYIIKLILVWRNNMGAAASIVGPIYGASAGADAASDAADVQAEGAQRAEDGINRRFDVTQESFRPFQEAGVAALGQQQALLGIGGEEAQNEAFAAFNESPGQKFIRDRAQKNLLRNAGSMGGIGGGNIRSALVEQGTGFAQQDFNNQFGRLGQIAGQGQNATTNVSQFGATAANQAGNAGIAQTEARASGILGRQQAINQGIGDIAGLTGTALGIAGGGQFGGGGATGGGMSNFSDIRLKDNIRKVGTDQNGGIYEFSYIGSAKKFIGRMAQELYNYKPESVTVHNSGFLQVSDEFAAREI